MKLAVLKETFPGERRVALVPTAIGPLRKLGYEVTIESGAGQAAGYPDDTYAGKGAKIAAHREDCFAVDVVVQVRSLGANREAGESDLPHFRAGHFVIGTCDPLGQPDCVQKIADTGASLLALELIPRIARAQSMDVLSSMACVAGYRAVLLAATELPKMFPLMMTAAGTLLPARAFVIGAGVAGLQAIATARRLGAVVHAYDVRAAVREQVESLGARFVELELESGTAEDQGGYAKAMDEEFYQKQRALMARVVAENDVVITTAAIPGKQSPLLITADAVHGMPPGSVIVDLAAERGGNCALSQPDKRIVDGGVVILGPTNLPSEVAFHASQMFSKNVTTLVQHLTSDGAIQLDMSDDITAGALATHDGQVVHPQLRGILDLKPLPVAQPANSPQPTNSEVEQQS